MISPEEALRTGGAWLDVRSEGEHAEGAIPGFINAPILTNEERHRVGIRYQEEGQEAAIRLGHELVDPHRAERVARWLRAGPGLLVACWRGGLRSRIATEWIREAGGSAVSLQGGYKALRAQLMAPFGAEVLADIHILSGLTGAGKTPLLRSLTVSTIDLEGHAGHRGSAFGLRAGETQPAQATFENAVALDYHRRRGPVWVEDESSRIGHRNLPPALVRAIATGPVVFLEVPLEARIHAIYEEYVAAPLRNGVMATALEADLARSTLALRKKLGGARTEEILVQLHNAFTAPEEDRHTPWIRNLLENYYDRAYRFAFGAAPSRPIVFRGGPEACRQWIQEAESG